MKKKSCAILAACVVNTTAGISSIINEAAPTGTGLGLLSIAVASISNTLAGEGIIPEEWKRKLGTCLITANMVPVIMGVKSIVDSASSTSTGLGQIALAGAAAVQCLDLLGVFKDSGTGTK